MKYKEWLSKEKKKHWRLLQTAVNQNVEVLWFHYAGILETIESSESFYEVQEFMGDVKNFQETLLNVLDHQKNLFQEAVRKKDIEEMKKRRELAMKVQDMLDLYETHKEEEE